MARPDSAFKALADPTRRKILRLIGEREMSAGEIAEHFEISGPSMSHHFNILKEADLVQARRKGQQIYYSLNTTVVQDVMGALMDVFGIGDKPVGEEDEKNDFDALRDR